MADNLSEYPPVGFYFKLQIGNLPSSESEFQEIAGLSRSIELLEVKEAGENRYKHQLASQIKSEPLILKRGMKVSSELTNWCKETLEDFIFKPKDLFLFLFDANSPPDSEPVPLVAWHFIHAYPTKWEVSGFNAMNSDLVIETIQINYNSFTKTFAKS